MSLLTLCQNAADRIGIPRPTSVFSSTDQIARQLLGLANQEGRELARRHPWQRLVTEYTFSTVASTIAYDLPSGFDRLIEGTIYNRTQTRPVIGPLNAQRWQQMQAVAITATWQAIYIRGNSMRFTPTPSAAETIAYEYASKYWCTTTGGTTGTLDAWSGDTDDAMLDEEVMTLGVMWRFQKAKGLDYSETFRTYEDQVSRRMAHDGGQRILDLSNMPSNGVFDPSIADGNWSIT